MPEPGPVEWDEAETRREPLPRWMLGCCVIYLATAIAGLLLVGYALARWLK